MIPARFSFTAAILSSILGIAAVSCTSSKPTPTAPVSLTAEQQISRGRAIYQSNCIACHHSNPRVAGAIGPDVWGSSFELLEARILHSAYPSGYKPKRETHAMQALPHLKPELSSLHTYLNSQTP